MAAKQLPDLATLNNLLICDADAGLLFWKRRPIEMFTSANLCGSWNARYADGPAFRVRSKLGYFYGEIMRQRYLTHRVIWKMATGIEPVVIDHINGDGLDNRITNLRTVDHTSNMQNRKLSANNTSGANGVDIWQGRYRARINHGGRTFHLGSFDTLAAAVEAQKRASDNMGFSPNHGLR